MTFLWSGLVMRRWKTPMTGSIDKQLLQPDQPLSFFYFSLIKERLYRVTQDAQTKENTTQLLVPKSRREMLFQAGHCSPMAGHLGKQRHANVSWPDSFHEDVRRWCAACCECQLVNPPATAKAPLRPLSLVEFPFERIGMDLIGPLERSACRHRFAFVLVDYATRYPEAVPLRNISAKSVRMHCFESSPEWESRKRFSLTRAQCLCHVR